MASKQPKWLTSNRKAQLLDLFNRSRGFCIFGHKSCLYPDQHYELFIEGLIRDWVKDDIAERLADWREEQKLLHDLGERRKPIRGRFSTISQDIFFGNQPQYYIIGYGISGLTLKPFVKIRLSSSYLVLYIELDKLADVSKSKKRKALRYRKRIAEIDESIKLAVRDCLK